MPDRLRKFRKPPKADSERPARRPDAAKVRSVLEDPGAYAVVLLAQVADLYPPDDDENSGWPEWSPVTLVMELDEDYGVKLPPDNFDKLMCAIAVSKGTVDPYNSAADFGVACKSLAGAFNAAMFEPPDAVECATGLLELGLINPPPRGGPPVGPEVSAMIAVTLREEGFSSVPAPLAAAVRGAFEPPTHDFADDPEMFAAIEQTGQERRAEVETAVRRKKAELAAQFGRLNLRDGDVRPLVTALSR